MRRWLLVLMAGALVLGWHPMLEAQDKGKLAVVDMEKFQRNPGTSRRSPRNCARSTKT